MSRPPLRTHQWGVPGAPLLVLGPSLGTSAAALWGACADRLAERFHVLAWDLPGHGHSPAPTARFTLADLAAAVLELVDEHAGPSAGFGYAGDSVGGAVGLQLALDAPDRVEAAVLLCTGARIGEPASWRERAERVRAAGTPVMVEHSARVWFAPGFLEREPGRGSALLDSLQQADPGGYAAVCEALADFDVRERLREITAPVLAVAGAQDGATPVAGLAEIAEGVRSGEHVVLDGVAHLAPAENPGAVARLIIGHLDGARRGEAVRRAGMQVRREVLGDAHVDRATAGATDLTAEFQDLITRYAWGTIWTRPGLDRRTRSLLTITALVAHGHHEELAMHLRAARRMGIGLGEIRETLLQSAIYCGVPAANTAFRIAGEVFAESVPGAETGDDSSTEPG